VLEAANLLTLLEGGHECGRWRSKADPPVQIPNVDSQSGRATTASVSTVGRVDAAAWNRASDQRRALPKEPLR
jgi:hypothetical protein